MTGPSRKSDTSLPPAAAGQESSDPTQVQISQQLRNFYDAVQDEGIPDKFLDLLDKLDRAEKAQSNLNK